MGPKVAKEDLEDIVEEAARLDDAEKAQLSRGEVKEVLRELDISPEKLDDAERAVAARRERAKSKRRVLAIAAAAVIAVAGVATAVAVHSRNAATRLARTTAAEHTVSANGQPQPFARAGSPEVRLDLTVHDAPQGEKLELSCEWTDPAGTRAHQNRWTTKAIDRDPWPTHCRYALAPTSPTGTWTVTMKQGDRVLASDPFDVR